MESTRVMMLVTMMIVMAMGNLLFKTEAQPEASPSPPPPGFLDHFSACIEPCVIPCLTKYPSFGQQAMCVIPCLGKCLLQSIFPGPNPSQMMLASENGQIDYYCTLGCATQRNCYTAASFQNKKNLNKARDCVGSCAAKCSY